MIKFVESIQSKGGAIVKMDNFWTVDFKDADDASIKIMKVLIDNPESVGISYAEFANADKIKESIKKYLGEE